MYDIVTVGEGMLRLSPPPYERLRRARTLDLNVCGSQGNVACNAARLGMKAGTLSAPRVTSATMAGQMPPHGCFSPA